MRQNLQLAGVMASILGLMAVAGLTIGARFQGAAPAVPVTAEVEPIPTPAPKSARRVRTPKVEVRLTYDGVSLNPSEDDSASPSIAVSDAAEHSVSDAECCQGLPVDEPAANSANSGFGSLALPYFTPVEEKLR